VPLVRKTPYPVKEGPDLTVGLSSQTDASLQLAHDQNLAFTLPSYPPCRYSHGRWPGHTSLDITVGVGSDDAA
jgi:hypothetical protein